VSVDHGFGVNKFFGDQSFSFSCAVLDNTIVKDGTVECKAGVATGTTFGTVMYRNPYFWVSSNEVGLFATPRDSGALVVTENSVAVGMVVRDAVKHTACLNICIVHLTSQPLAASC
jgi:hypothetical protein